MDFEIVSVSPKKLVGKSMVMSFIENRTGQLWGIFMSELKEIRNKIGDERISLQIYSDEFMQNPKLQFRKWALVEVTNFELIPSGFEQFNLAGGVYAIFPYKGNIIQAPGFF